MIAQAAGIVPVEYAVAVDRYLAEAELGPASRRVYRISLASWAWPLVGKLPPAGLSRRKASPPVVPLALLDDETAGLRLAGALKHRMSQAGARTVNRELSALRSAIGWWRRREWIAADPTIFLRQAELAGESGPRLLAVRPLDETQLTMLFRTPAGLREQAFWHLLLDTGAAAEAVLTLDAGTLDLARRRATLAGAGHGQLEWGSRTGELLSWLLAGRRGGPVFLTDRRAPAGTAGADLCPLTGRGRLSYRRAAEIFTEHTRLLDPDGRGWMLHQLRRRPVG
ncbi:MAG TPA: site-specific recombinase [Streptosporangiaceae bacterium]|nr:site-specific recombinase [Streptosporangiaceae bacterium]